MFLEKGKSYESPVENGFFAGERVVLPENWVNDLENVKKCWRNESFTWRMDYCDGERPHGGGESF